MDGHLPIPHFHIRCVKGDTQDAFNTAGFAQMAADQENDWLSKRPEFTGHKEEVTRCEKLCVFLTKNMIIHYTIRKK